MDYYLLAPNLQRVPGVIASLKPDHHIRAAGQEVNDLAFSFVTPLSSYNDKRAQDENLSPLLLYDGDTSGPDVPAKKTV